MDYAETSIRVRYAETDQMGVVYHGNYFTWFEVGRVELVPRSSDLNTGRWNSRMTVTSWWPTRTAGTSGRRDSTILLADADARD